MPVLLVFCLGASKPLRMSSEKMSGRALGRQVRPALHQPFEHHLARECRKLDVSLPQVWALPAQPEWVKAHEWVGDAVKYAIPRGDAGLGGVLAWADHHVIRLSDVGLGFDPKSPEPLGEGVGAEAHDAQVPVAEAGCGAAAGQALSVAFSASHARSFSRAA